MDNELKKFREDAAKKYEQYRQQKEAEEAVKAFEESEKVANELKITQESDAINSFFIEIDTAINELKTSDDIFLILQIIQTRIISIIELLREHNRLSEIQDKVLIFVEIMNNLHANKTKDITYVSQVNTIVKNIFELCEVEIEIELMDTSEDDDFAMKLQAEMYNMNINENNIGGAEDVGPIGINNNGFVVGGGGETGGIN
jgi:hypothetical protein